MHQRLDDELTELDRERLDSHCARCPSCRAAQDELAVVDRILFEIGVEDRAIPAPLAAPKRSFARSRIGALAASALIVIAFYCSGPPTPPAPRVARTPVAPRDDDGFEITAEDLLAVTVPSHNPRVKIVWLYQPLTMKKEGLIR